MKFFKEPEQSSVASTPKPSGDESINSILGAEISVQGDISFRGKVRVDGKINGNVKGEYLILGESGKINGDIEANSLICYGEITGNIKVEKLSVQKTSFINGKIETNDLFVDSGASLNSEVRAGQKKGQVIKGSFEKTAQKADSTK